MKTLYVWLGLAMLFCNAIPLHAQWIQTNGPYSDDITSLALHGDALFAGTNGGGIYLSMDNGVTWISRSYGLLDANIYALTISGTTLFAGSLNGVFYSGDSGVTWYPSSLPFNTLVTSLNARGNDIFAGTDGKGIYHSSDQGITWALADSGLNSKFVHSLCIAGDTIFAGTGGGGVFRSTNNGLSWDSASAGMTVKYIYGLAYDGMNLFAGTDSMIVYHSADQGRTWTEVHIASLGKGVIVALAIHGTQVFAGSSDGVYTSSDSGVTWSKTMLQPYTNCFTIAKNELLAGTELGIYNTTGNGSSWNISNSGLGYTSVTAITADGNDLYAGTYYGGVFRSTNSGQEWLPYGLSYKNITSLVIYNHGLLAGTDPDGMFFSSDSGKHWMTLPAGSNNNVHALAVDSLNLFEGTDDGVLGAIGGGNIVNTGLSGVPVYCLKVFGSTVLAGTNTGVFYSVDSGKSWVLSNLPNYYVYSLGAQGKTLFAGCYFYGVYRSVDSGRTWIASNIGLTDSNIFAFALSGNTLFAATDSGVFLTVNQGKTWSIVDPDLTNTNIQTLAVIGSNLFAGAYYGGVWEYPLADHAVVPELKSPRLEIEAPYPNPVRSSTTINFSSPQTSNVSITILDETGRSTLLLDAKLMSAGRHTVAWNSAGFANGVYLCRIQIGRESTTQKLCVLH